MDKVNEPVPSKSKGQRSSKQYNITCTHSIHPQHFEIARRKEIRTNAKRSKTQSKGLDGMQNILLKILVNQLIKVLYFRRREKQSSRTLSAGAQSAIPHITLLGDS